MSPAHVTIWQVRRFTECGHWCLEKINHRYLSVKLSFQIKGLSLPHKWQIHPFNLKCRGMKIGLCFKHRKSLVVCVSDEMKILVRV